MAKHERIKRIGPEEQEEDLRKKKVSRPPSYDQLKTSDEGTTDLILRQSMDDHAVLLAKAASDERRASLLTQLQQSYGNAYVQRVVEHASAKGQQGTKHQVPADISIDAIRVVDMEDGASLLFDLRAAMDGEGTVPAEGTEAETEQELEPTELSIGGVGTAEDAIRGEIGVFYTIDQGKLDLGAAFGMAECNYRGRIWARPRTLPSGSRYDVRVRVACKYTWDTDSHGHKDIRGPRDRDVTEDGWSQVVFDLTPAAATPARSPRVEHWCGDLTTKHERFHIQDWVEAFRTYRPVAETWLNGQSASSVQDASGKAKDAVSLMVTNVNTYMGSGDYSPAEVRAYADGASSYRERAEAVQARAVAEKWPEGPVVSPE